MLRFMDLSLKKLVENVILDKFHDITKTFPNIDFQIIRRKSLRLYQFMGQVVGYNITCNSISTVICTRENVQR